MGKPKNPADPHRIERHKPDMHDKAELKKSLEKWARESKKEHARFLLARRLWAQARKHVKARRRQIKRLQVGPVKKFLKLCIAHAGEHEVGFSNTGPQIDKWEAECGMRGQPYCAMFLMYFYHRATGRQLGAGYAYTPNILNAAKQGVDFDLVHGSNYKPGDWVLYNFGSSAPVQHVGAIMHVRNPATKDFETIEGNTSPGNGGSQDNGGGIYIRNRKGQGIVAVVRPHWN
jgi:hypothetical protein